MEMFFLPDQPITSKTEDVLGLSSFTDLIYNSLQSTTPPFVYGILGDWGTGKTSVLSMLKESIEQGDSALVPIWFNAWKYENEINVIYPLLHVIKSEYIKQFGTLSPKFRRSFGDVVAASVLALSDLSLRFVTKHITGEALSLGDISEQITNVHKATEEAESALEKWADEVDKADKAFASLLDDFAEDLVNTDWKLKKAQDIRFVILVDDLDRCLPEVTIAVLERIKNFLLVDKCIFVLALNPHVVYQGIKIKYQGMDIDGREYLEKILNYSFYIPEPSTDTISKFAMDRLQQLVSDKTEQEIHLDYFREFGKVVQSCQFINPRKIKRILNRYLFLIQKYSKDVHWSEYHIPNVIRLIILAEYYPLLFNLLVGSDDPKATSDKLAKANKAEMISIDFGIKIPPTYLPLFKLNDLFKLRQTGLNMKREIEAVYSITRII